MESGERTQPPVGPGQVSLDSAEPPHTESGQATAEYALVMLAAAALAGLLITWAAGTDGIGRLLDAVMDSLIRDAG